VNVRAFHRIQSVEASDPHPAVLSLENLA